MRFCIYECMRGIYNYVWIYVCTCMYVNRTKYKLTNASRLLKRSEHSLWGEEGHGGREVWRHGRLTQRIQTFQPERTRGSPAGEERNPCMHQTCMYALYIIHLYIHTYKHIT